MAGKLALTNSFESNVMSGETKSRDNPDILKASDNVPLFVGVRNREAINFEDTESEQAERDTRNVWASRG